MSKLLVDTNVLIYAKDVSSLYHDVSLSLFTKTNEFYITTKNLTEYAVVTKGEKPLLSPVNALDDIKEFMSYCIVLYPNPVSYQRLEELILRYEPKGVLIHDFEIAAIALASGITKVATFNKGDFQMIKEIEIITPS
jgi:predicted nucleic acid-binding protein